MSTNIPQVAINDIGDEQALLEAVEKTIKVFNDGDLVSGQVVKIDHDEVLLDIGYKTEGVIPSRELSISTTSTPLRLSSSAPRLRHSSSPRRTRKVA